MTELNGDVEKLIGCLYDSMTECIYPHPITSFSVETKPQLVFEVDILGTGRAALEKANDELGESFFFFFLPPHIGLSSVLISRHTYLPLSLCASLSPTALCESTLCVLMEVIMSHEACTLLNSDVAAPYFARVCVCVCLKC